MNPGLAIGICTFRRPGVVQTLDSVCGLRVQGRDVIVIVADNDDTPSAETAVKRAPCGLSLHYLHAPARNISIARNAILAKAREADVRYLAFIDDDETVDPDWLDQLLQCHAASGAAAVLGPVRAAYLPGAPDWMRRAAVHDTEPVRDTAGAVLSGYTCNVLIDMAHPATAGLVFDPARGRAGGEDTAFFHALRRAGGQIAYAPFAVARETVPADRAQLRWLLRRRFRMGQTHGSLIGAGQSLGRRLAAAGIAGAKALACGGLMVLRLADPVGRNRAVMRGALHLGVVAALGGYADLQIYGGPAAHPVALQKEPSP